LATGAKASVVIGAGGGADHDGHGVIVTATAGGEAPAAEHGRGGAAHAATQDRAAAQAGVEYRLEVGVARVVVIGLNGVNRGKGEVNSLVHNVLAG
jgi:hypothetical protein